MLKIEPQKLLRASSARGANRTNRPSRPDEAMHSCDPAPGHRSSKGGGGMVAGAIPHKVGRPGCGARRAHARPSIRSKTVNNRRAKGATTAGHDDHTVAH